MTRLSLEERFWSKVSKGGPDDCWPYTKPLYRNGYGMFTVANGKSGGKKVLAHRMAFELTFGPPKDKVDHTCHNEDETCSGGWKCPHRPCCNPAHLEDVTQRTNLLRGDTIVSKFASRTHCANGHEFTEENTRIYRGYRDCRTCGRERQRKRRAA